MAVPVDPAAADLEALANPAPPAALVPAIADPVRPAPPAPHGVGGQQEQLNEVILLKVLCFSFLLWFLVLVLLCF